MYCDQAGEFVCDVDGVARSDLVFTDERDLARHMQNPYTRGVYHRGCNAHVLLHVYAGERCVDDNLRLIQKAA